MGNCIRSSNTQDETNDRSTALTHRKKVVTKSQPLKRDKIKWKSDIPLTSYHVMTKRDEFWDTAPAFEGRQEIWDALKAAAEAVEKGDYELAQAIVDGANIILPSGNLRDCYDELGNRYQLPLYVLSLPTNLYEPQQQQLVTTSPTTHKSVNKHFSKRSTSSASHKHQSKPSSSSSSQLGSSIPTGAQCPASNADNKTVALRLRLSSNNKDYQLNTHTNYQILQIKQQFSELIDNQYSAEQQRWFCYGRLIDNYVILSQTSIPPDVVIQVIVNGPPQNSVDINNSHEDKS